MAIPTNNKKRWVQKSVKLSKTELNTLLDVRSTSNSDTALSKDFNIDRVSLVRIITVGSGSEANIKKIRRKLSRLTSIVNQ